MKNKIPSLVIVRPQSNHLWSSKRTTSKNPHRQRKVKLKKWKLFEEYCENSTIHGLRYISKENVHPIERIWWIISVSFSVVGCCISISESYNKWTENPVIVTFSERMTPLRDISFPAITICPETKTQKSVFDYSEALKKIKLDSPPLYGLTEREYALTTSQFQVCGPSVIQNNGNIGENFTTDIIFDLIREVAPNMSQSLIACTFRTFTGFCDEVFQEIITDDGLCFTFNAVNSSTMFMDDINEKIMSQSNMTGLSYHWTLEDGYDVGYKDNFVSDVYLYPFRVLNAGSKAGLKIKLAMKMDDMDYVCRGPVQGFKVVLHTPNELPQVDGQYFRIPVGQDVRVSIKANVLKTMKSLRGYQPTRRQCFFNSERKLRYLRTYTQRNCELECLTNFTIRMCGCVKYSMPHDNTTPICGIAMVNCYTLAEVNLLENSSTIEASMKINSCNCLPACTSISYESEISQASYEWKKYFKALNFSSQETEGFQFAALSIFFKENQFITSKRSELVTLTDFISSCGGLLGLFMGVSILSIVEIIYYLSLRLFFNARTSSKIVPERKTLPKLKPRITWEQSKQPWYIARK